MICSRFNLPGMLVAGIGLVVLFASPGQAEAAEWLVLNGGKLLTITEIEANKEKFAGSIDNKSASLLATVFGIPFELLCTAGELIDALLGPEGSVKKGTKAQFTGCVMIINPKGKSKTCNVHSAGRAMGTIETSSFHVSNLGFVAPDNELSKAFLTLEMGEDCPFFEVLEFTGSLSFKGLGVEHLTTHLLVASTTGLYVNGSAATVEGSVKISLNSGRAWTGD